VRDLLQVESWMSFICDEKSSIFYPEGDSSGSGSSSRGCDCSLEKGGEGHDGGEESGELHVEMNSSA
jgi:hypothetical protein